VNFAAFAACSGRGREPEDAVAACFGREPEDALAACSGPEPEDAVEPAVDRDCRVIVLRTRKGDAVLASPFDLLFAIERIIFQP
jgi:hypothetical protein